MFTNIFTVQAGATLNVTNPPVVGDDFGESPAIVVDGTMNATGTSFTHTNTNPGDAAITISAGGHLMASGCDFNWAGMTLAVGSTLNAGDLTGNAFDLPLSAPAIDAALLANNLRFQDIDIIGNLTTGQTATLNPLGTQTTANQRYVFTNIFTVQAGQR